MGDEKYIRLDPARMGFKFVGKVPTEQQSTLLRALEALKRDMGSAWDSQLAAKEIFWLNIWQHEDDIEDEADMMRLSDSTLGKTLDEWCRTAVEKYCEPGAIMDGYGFVVNPTGSRHQVWHVDYTTDAAAIWIPITPFTDKNATQFLTIPSNTPEEVLEQVASAVDQVDVEALARELDYLIVQQIVAKPMSILYMGRGTIHRGIPNSGNDHRIGFYISVHFITDYAKNYPYENTGLYEGGVAVFETAADRKQSAAAG
jgi:hypothetical protein